MLINELERRSGTLGARFKFDVYLCLVGSLGLRIVSIFHLFLKEQRSSI